MDCPSVCAGASVLPYTWGPDGNLYLLLAQDANGKKWSDFGGGLLNRWEREEWCATRELKEESHGLIRVADVNTCPKVRFQFYDHKGRLRHYTTFLAQVSYDTSLVKAFHKERLKVRCTSLPPKITKARLEKIQINYLLPDIKGTLLRPFFKQRLTYLTPYLDQIRHAIQTAQKIPLRGLLQTVKLRGPP